MLFTTLPLFLLSAISVLAHIPQRPQNHQHAKRQFEIDERGLPVTATTTVRVQTTLTQTVWVTPTGQVVWDTPSSSVSASASASTDVSSSALASQLQSASSSADVSASTEASSSSEVASSSVVSSASTSAESAEASTSSSAAPSQAISASASRSQRASSSASALPSASMSAIPSESSLAASASSSDVSVSASASASSESASASESSSASTSDKASSISRSASRTNRPSALSSASSASQTSAVASLTLTESASAEPTSSSASSSGFVSRSTSRSVRNSSAAPPSSSAAPSSSTDSSSTAESSSVASSTLSSAVLPTATPQAGSVRDGLLMNGYYPDWSSWKLQPEAVDWSKFDVVDFAFAIPTADFGLVFTQDDSSDLLRRLVASAHANGKLVKLSIGGWTGSVHFSDACKNSWNRQTFIGNIVEAYDSYGIDGIDLDWEYPGFGGASGNVVTTSDSANFLLFLQELRAALPSGALITAATQVWPFADDSTPAQPMKDVSAFAAVLDWILIMNYDIWGSAIDGGAPGSNAPLSDACGTSTQPLANAEAAVNSWTKANFPANKITLGVPAYGYLSKSSATSLKTRRRANRRADVTIFNDNGGTADGQIGFSSLVSQGALWKENGIYVGGGGFERNWDSCSSTPFIRSSSSGQIVTYDDPQSLSMKGQFAARKGLRGCNVFSMDGDTAGGELVAAVRSGMGI